jgi:hypothetical protein
MRRPTHAAAARIVSGGVAARLALASVLMAGLALAVVAWGQDRYTLTRSRTRDLCR